MSMLGSFLVQFDYHVAVYASPSYIELRFSNISLKLVYFSFPLKL